MRFVAAVRGSELFCARGWFEMSFGAITNSVRLFTNINIIIFVLFLFFKINLVLTNCLNGEMMEMLNQ